MCGVSVGVLRLVSSTAAASSMRLVVGDDACRFVKCGRAGRKSESSFEGVWPRLWKAKEQEHVHLCTFIGFGAVPCARFAYKSYFSYFSPPHPTKRTTRQPASLRTHLRRHNIAY
jgi:hypothetical protein